MSIDDTAGLTPVPSDAELITAVRGGDSAAFAVLWSRHKDAADRLARHIRSGRPADAEELVSETFTRIFRLLQAGRGPDVAFRPYLLSAVRRLAIDDFRSSASRVMPTAELSVLDVEVAEAAEAVSDQRQDQIAALRAWDSLPEASRTILWHLVIEEDTPSKVATLMGTTPAAVSSRAVRAKERLRQAFLQEHLADSADLACRSTRSKFGGYVRNSLSERDRLAVQRHLDVCERGCPAAALELSDVNMSLRMILGPAVLGPAAAWYLGAPWTSGPAANQLCGRPHGHSAAAAAVAVAVACLIAAAGVSWTLVDDQGHQGTPGASPNIRTAPASPADMASPSIAPVSSLSPFAASTTPRLEPSSTVRPTPSSASSFTIDPVRYPHAAASADPGAADPNTTDSAGPSTTDSAGPGATRPPSPSRRPAAPRPGPPSRPGSTHRPTPRPTAPPSTSTPSPGRTPRTGAPTTGAPTPMSYPVAFTLSSPDPAGSGTLNITAPDGWTIRSIDTAAGTTCSRQGSQGSCAVQINGAASVPFLVTVHGIPAGFTGRAVHVVYTDSNGSVTSGDIAF